MFMLWHILVYRCISVFLVPRAKCLAGKTYLKWTVSMLNRMWNFSSIFMSVIRLWKKTVFVTAADRLQNMLPFSNTNRFAIDCSVYEWCLDVIEIVGSTIADTMSCFLLKSATLSKGDVSVKLSPLSQAPSGLSQPSLKSGSPQPLKTQLWPSFIRASERSSSDVSNLPQPTADDLLSCFAGRDFFHVHFGDCVRIFTLYFCFWILEFALLFFLTVQHLCLWCVKEIKKTIQNC